MKRKEHERRERGFGGLEKRKGYYLARWTVEGKRFSQSLRTTDRKEAEKMLKNITAPFRLSNDADRFAFFAAKVQSTQNEIDEIRKTLPAIALDDVWEYYINSPERPERPQRVLEIDGARWGRFLDFMKKHFPDIHELRKVSREHAAGFMTIYGKTVSGFSYNRMARMLKMIWNFMYEQPCAKLEGKNPFARITMQTVKEIKRRALNADELRRVCAFVDGEYKLLFAIGIYTGLRLVDAALLKWESVDMTRHVIICKPYKTARYGTMVNIPIHATLFFMLAQIPESERRGYVMPDMVKDYKSKSILFHIKRIFESCGIDTTIESPDNGRKRCIVGFHSLRHSFVSMAANGGAPLAVVQKIVGHTTAQMTAHYFHESDAALNAAVSLLPDVIGTDEAGQHKEPQRAKTAAYEAFENAARKLTPEELHRAIEYLANLQKAEVVEI